MKPTLILLTSVLMIPGAFKLRATPVDANEVNPVEVGSTAPDVILAGSDNTTVSLHALAAKNPIVLIFYRGGWCPYCRTHLMELAQVEAELMELGFQIIAVSPDSPESLNAMLSAADQDPVYALYSDATAAAAKAFGLAFQVDADTYEKLLGYGIDLEAASGEDHHLLPVPAVFLIGHDGKIRFRYFNPDYKARISGEELLAAARAAAKTDPE